MTKLADGAEFYKYYATLDNLGASDKEELKINADQLFNRFKDYKVAVVTLGDMSIQDVAPIFERINSTGTRLTIVDLMRAATWSQDFDLIDSIDSVLENLKSKDFGGIDRKIVLRVISAATGGGFSAESIDNLRNFDTDVLKEAMNETAAAFEKTVDYLSTQIGVPNDSIIPYSNQLVVLTEIFRLNPKPTTEHYQAIKRWFWRSASSGYFSGWNTGMMARDKDSVIVFTSGKTKDIEFSNSEPNKNIWEQRQFRADGAHAKTLAIMLAHNSPIDLLTGQKIDPDRSLSWTNAKEYHHFFPKDYLKTQGFSTSQANCLSNIIMLSSTSNKQISNRSPSNYLLDVERVAGDNLNAWLKSNLVSVEAFTAAKNDDYELFLRERTLTIHNHVKSLSEW